MNIRPGYLFTSILLLASSSVMAEYGDLCTKTELPTMGTGATYSGFYFIRLDHADHASIDGYQCLSDQSGAEDCVAAYGQMTYDKGNVELSTSGSSMVSTKQYGDVYGFSMRFTSIDTTTLVGSTTMVTTYSINGKTTQTTDTGRVTVVPCPRLTVSDKENLANLKSFLRKANKLK